MVAITKRTDHEANEIIGLLPSRNRATTKKLISLEELAAKDKDGVIVFESTDRRMSSKVHLPLNQNTFMSTEEEKTSKRWGAFRPTPIHLPEQDQEKRKFPASSRLIEKHQMKKRLQLEEVNILCEDILTTLDERKFKRRAEPLSSTQVKGAGTPGLKKKDYVGYCSIDTKDEQNILPEEVQKGSYEQ